MQLEDAMKYKFKLISQAATSDLVLNGQVLYYSFPLDAISLWFSIYGRHGVLNFSLCHKGPEINIGQITESEAGARTWQQRAEVPWRRDRAGLGRATVSFASTFPVCPPLGAPSTAPGRWHPLPRLLLPSPHWNSTSSTIIQAPKIHI